MEKTVLFAEWLVVLAGMRLCRLEGHIRVGHLGYVAEIEDAGQQEDEARDGQVHPLHVLQGAVVVEGEEDVRPQHGRDDGADAVEGLRDVDAHLGELWRAADGDVRVRRRLEAAEPVPYDEDARAEPAEGFGLDGRDGEEGADSVEAQTPDEDGPVAKVAQDPGCMSERGKRVCSDMFSQ
jgi:hypothetical protein